MTSPIKLIVGLGNPASSYFHTRHNIGREFIDYLARDWGEARSKKQLNAFTAPSGEFEGLKAGYLDSFMNESGAVLQKYLYAENIPIEKVLIVVDDFMIPLGTCRLRAKGSSGGHNGLKNIIEVFGTDVFPRLRVGIGPVPGSQDPADFVLQKFSKPELSLIDKIFPEIETGLRALVENGVEKGMTALNKKFFEPTTP